MYMLSSDEAFLASTGPCTMHKYKAGSITSSTGKDWAYVNDGLSELDLSMCKQALASVLRLTIQTTPSCALSTLGAQLLLAALLNVARVS